jgi:hypothetical protein
MCLRSLAMPLKFFSQVRHSGTIVAWTDCTRAPLLVLRRKSVADHYVNCPKLIFSYACGSQPSTTSARSGARLTKCGETRRMHANKQDPGAAEQKGSSGAH